jgi:hypothetical protein
MPFRGMAPMPLRHRLAGGARMALTAPAALLVTTDVAAGAEAAFDEWYIREHLPERVGVPGFLRGRRWRCVGEGPRDLILYELEAIAVLGSAPYLARLAEPTPATRQMMPFFRNMSRSACHVAGAAGSGDGGAAVLLPVARAGMADVRGALGGLARQPGVLAVALLDADAAGSRSDTTESRLRAAPDLVIDLAAWIEATEPQHAMAAAARLPHAAGPAMPYRVVAAMLA